MRYRPTETKSGMSLLATSWAILILLIGGGIGWLVIVGEKPASEREEISARVTVKLPPPLPATPSAMPPATPESAAEEVPTLATSAPVVSEPVTPAPVISSAPETPASKAPEVAHAAVPIPVRPADEISLSPIPDPDLVEEGQKGPLPVIASDGRKPWQVYARPFDATDRRPRIAIVVNWLGLSDAATEGAIQDLPGAVTLAFAPYAENLLYWMRLSRVAGHEALLNLPMEPLNYPANDPGPQALLTSLSPARNLDRLEWTLSRVSGYVGVTNYMGSRFTTSAEALKPVLKVLKSRGLLFLDSRSSARSLVSQVAEDVALPWVANNRFLDNQASRIAIDRELEALETLARRQGYAVGIAFPYPVTLERLAAWIPTLQKKGFVLAPVSALVGVEKPAKTSAKKPE